MTAGKCVDGLNRPVELPKGSEPQRSNVRLGASPASSGPKPRRPHIASGRALLPSSFSYQGQACLGRGSGDCRQFAIGPSKLIRRDRAFTQLLIQTRGAGRAENRLGAFHFFRDALRHREARTNALRSRRPRVQAGSRTTRGEPAPSSSCLWVSSRTHGRTSQPPPAT